MGLRSNGSSREGQTAVAALERSTWETKAIIMFLADGLQSLVLYLYSLASIFEKLWHCYSLCLWASWWVSVSSPRSSHNIFTSLASTPQCQPWWRAAWNLICIQSAHIQDCEVVTSGEDRKHTIHLYETVRRINSNRQDNSRNTRKLLSCMLLSQGSHQLMRSKLKVLCSSWHCSSHSFRAVAKSFLKSKGLTIEVKAFLFTQLAAASSRSLVCL